MKQNEQPRYLISKTNNNEIKKKRPEYQLFSFQGLKTTKNM